MPTWREEVSIVTLGQTTRAVTPLQWHHYAEAAKTHLHKFFLLCGRQGKRLDGSPLNYPDIEGLFAVVWWLGEHPNTDIGSMTDEADPTESVMYQSRIMKRKWLDAHTYKLVLDEVETVVCDGKIETPGAIALQKILSDAQELSKASQNER